MRIGEALVKEGLITSEELKIALDEQKRIHDRLGDIVVKTGLVSADKMSPFLAQYFDIPFVKLSDVYKEIKADVIDIVPIELSRRFTLIPIDIKERSLIVAIADPLNLLAIDTLRIKTGHKIQCVVALENEISEAIEYCYQHLPRLKKYADNFVELEVAINKIPELDSEVGRYGADDQPVIQYVRSLIVQAMNSRASDIHLQAKQDSAELRFRIDGVLYDIDPPPKAMISAITTRIKIVSGLDIAERRLPQDGRFKVKVGKAEVDIRTSTFPTIYGESVVMRLLDTSAPLLGLEQLGFFPSDLEKFKEIINCSYGMILVTGPTGSGKTTTLYTSLNAVKSAEKNIITLEDPVEYRLPFLQQSQINTQIGFDFAKGLRSILRQDPDIIMVGEIRDKETAEIAIHAALTGHLVFATLHTNDAAGAAVRLVKMGVEPFLITSALLGIIAQRLIRTICQDCKETYRPKKETLDKFSLNPAEIAQLSRGKGCAKCLQSGYRGRKGIYELLVPNEEIRNMILQQCSTEDMRKVAEKSGMRTLRQIGIDNLKQGYTTPEEVLRVTQGTAFEEVDG